MFVVLKIICKCLSARAKMNVIDMSTEYNTRYIDLQTILNADNGQCPGEGNIPESVCGQLE